MDAQAAAEKQTELTETRIDVEVAQNRGDAALARAERFARRDIARAEGRSRARELLGKGEAVRIAQTGRAEADVFAQKIAASGDARLFTLGSALQQLAHSRQPLVPERLFVLGGQGGDGATGGGANLLGQLFTLLLAERATLRNDATGG
jgi:regulator of protease activity HflC (stomatin/prohibitin superfamily)